MIWIRADSYDGEAYGITVARDGHDLDEAKWEVHGEAALCGCCGC